MTETEAQPASLPRGFQWGAVRAGIKASGNPDLAIAFAPRGATAAAMYTRNQVVAAPVIVGRKHLAAARGRVSAVLVNAGNANCATGEPGLKACLETCRATAETFGCIFDEVIPSSTGIIGVPFPTDKVLTALPALRAAIGTTPAHAEAFASAILTTDTRMKVARATVDVEGPTGLQQIRIFGCAKGAGMIHPQLGSALAPDAPKHATMLVYLFTDLAADPAELAQLLTPAVENSFNSISVDGDTSTNDTVLLMASGTSRIRLDTRIEEAFTNALKLVTASLAHQIVDDGEGVGHVVTLDVRGLESVADARQIAKAIAHSPLCKTAWSSADPNWGRLLAASGYSGIAFNPNAVTIWIGDVLVFENGTRATLYDEAAAHQAMLPRDYTITLQFSEGQSSTRFITCDLTAEYVRINADYST